MHPSNMLKNLNKYFILMKPLWFSLILLFAACAQVVRPTGGKTDSESPQVVKYLPENKTLNFNGKAFSIQFNEFFVIRDVSKQWIISPPLKTTPEYKIKGKLLTITFDDTLKENTTYSFSFGKSIADVNEGNELLGLSYIFSTGTFIDSIQLNGSVSKSFNNTKEKEVLVMLYEESRCKEDSFPYKLLPDYFALSDATGNYAIKYVKEGKYKAIALKDANSNYLFDSFEEGIGFCDSTINLTANSTLDFKLFNEIEHKTYLKNKFNSEYGCFTLIFNKALPQLEIVALHKSTLKDWAYIEQNKTNDTINFFLKDFKIDTLKLALKNNNTAFDTVEFPVLPKEKFKNKNNRVIISKTIIKVNPANGSEKNLNSPVSLSFNHPVMTVNADSILFLNGKKSEPFKLLKKDSLGKKYELDAKLFNDSSYSLTILPDAFKDCFGNSNDTTRSNFKVPSVESVGNLFLTISADSTAKLIDFKKESFLLQLTNEKGEILEKQRINDYGTISYLNLKPGNYKAQVVIDSNKNDQWDTGHFLKKLQPERIIFMNTTMSLRANWDLEEDWKFGVK